MATRIVVDLAILMALAIPGSADDRPSYLPPERVSVLPVFLVPKGAAEPTKREHDLFGGHVKWAQARYREMLGGDTFTLAREQPDVVPLRHPMGTYRKLPAKDTAPAWTAELLAHYELTRFECPYVFVAVVHNPADRFPVGGGRPLNGGYGTGGGIVVLSTFALTKLPNFQSTLQHEIGHGFGLPHVDVYRYDMKRNASIMSYNPAHHTNGVNGARVPGHLIPEDLRGLGLNRRAFAKFAFVPNRMVPRGYDIHPKIVPLGPMTIPGHPDYAVEVSTDGGEDFGSAVSNVVVNTIEPSAGPGVRYNAKTMWHSRELATGSTHLDLRFPFPVELTAMTVHSEHSGKSHAVKGATIQARYGSDWNGVASKPLDSADAVVEFPPTTAREWRVELRAGTSRRVVVRGLRFLHGEEEVFPQLVPLATKLRPSGSQ